MTDEARSTSGGTSHSKSFGDWCVGISSELCLPSLDLSNLKLSCLWVSLTNPFLAQAMQYTTKQCKFYTSWHGYWVVRTWLWQFHMGGASILCVTRCIFLQLLKFFVGQACELDKIYSFHMHAHLSLIAIDTHIIIISMISAFVSSLWLVFSLDHWVVFSFPPTHPNTSSPQIFTFSLFILGI